MPRRFRVVCPIQHLHETLRQSSCVGGARRGLLLCLCLCVMLVLVACKWIQTKDNITTLIKHCLYYDRRKGGALSVEEHSVVFFSNMLRFMILEINNYIWAKADWLYGPCDDISWFLDRHGHEYRDRLGEVSHFVRLRGKMKTCFKTCN